MDWSFLIKIAEASPSILIASAITYFLSQRRYTFEKLFDKRLVYLEEIYGKVTSLEDEINRYAATTGSNLSKETSDARTKELQIVKERFFELRRLFREREIVLGQSCVYSLEKLLDTINRVSSELQGSHISSKLDDDKTSFDFWLKAIKRMEEQFPEVKKNLKESFKEALENRN